MAEKDRLSNVNHSAICLQRRIKISVKAFYCVPIHQKFWNEIQCTSVVKHIHHASVIWQVMHIYKKFKNYVSQISDLKSHLA